ncbi:TIGR04104 family putative zinc finger protein [Jeotgalicoccus sp. S0W5]|uniref:TIGR04104 family putative zinc finger protein n=1 Tax=Jeotgalicoccus sp. S0W5 TaxID=2527874 RepID=UPI0014152908|nr:TIGR04104 family putative zinc finger protein [Jeotgalicoccus sp. S0W5]
MTKCASCKKQWTGLLLFKGHFASQNGVECDYCGKMQYVSEKSKKRMIIPLLLVTGMLLIGLFAPPSITQYFWVYITITAVTLIYMYVSLELTDIPPEQ